MQPGGSSVSTSSQKLQHQQSQNDSNSLHHDPSPLHHTAVSPISYSQQVPSPITVSVGSSTKYNNSIQKIIQQQNSVIESHLYQSATHNLMSDYSAVHSPNMYYQMMNPNAMHSEHEIKLESGQHLSNHHNISRSPSSDGNNDDVHEHYHDVESHGSRTTIVKQE